MSNEKTIVDSGYFHIRPAANHILTVGKGIIKDPYTAILELVKNAFDADAENVYISLILLENTNRITINDDGHGMSYDVVTKKWMVPSTQEKLRQKTSRLKKRPLQGRKGIGRYAASILGDDLLMKTTDSESSNTTELYINWSEFANDLKFLEEVQILIENYNSKEEHGTYLEITGVKKWSDRELDELVSTLRRLLSPLDEIDNDFNIYLSVKKNEGEKYSNFSEKIKPLPVLEYYHYRVYGKVEFLGHDEDGNDNLIANLTIENKRLKNILPISIKKNIILDNSKRYSSGLEIDIRAFDLDGEFNSIEIGELDFQKQLSELPGIAVIKDGFRVRPYGDKKVDWLGLDRRRYNNPTLRLSNNQVAGYVTVLQEEESHLEEKASREGFKENEFYEGLISIILICLSELEPIRYKFRKQHKKGGRKQKSINEQIDEVSNFEALNDKIYSLFQESNLSDEVFVKVKKVIDEEAREKAEKFEEIKNTIARYQGQVTLGKILTVVFHEGRKPLNALKQHPKFITEWSKEFIKTIESNNIFYKGDMELLFNKILDRLNDNKKQAELFINIFKKLEPLANSKRAVSKEFSILKPIEDSFKLFEIELSEKGISFLIIGNSNLKYIGWEIDFQIVFANLIENSIHWLSNSVEKKIIVEITEDDDEIIIDYQDTGVGIDEENIQHQDIFDPGFTTKEEGTGLGLSIAGESIERNSGKIEAIRCSTGANFIIKLKNNL